MRYLRRGVVEYTLQTTHSGNHGRKQVRRKDKMKKDYLNKLNWAVFTMIDRTIQDDHKSKVYVSGAFVFSSNAEGFIKTLPTGHKWYVLDFDRLERFEEFYNFVQDINEQYGDYAIFHINDGGFLVDELNCFRSILNIWTDTKIK